MHSVAALRGLVLLSVGLATAVQAAHHLLDTDLTQLFSDPVLPAFKEPWSRESYGLTTFAAAPPLRCFGVDSETPYDVAVLGIVPVSPSYFAMLITSRTGAPFDTSTSYRPG